MAMTASTPTSGMPTASVASGQSGRQMRRRPNVPILASRAESMTVTPIGASVYAPGSQVWNGTSGILTANPTARARNRYVCGVAARCRGLPGLLEHPGLDQVGQARERERESGDRCAVVDVEHGAGHAEQGDAARRPA